MEFHVIIPARLQSGRLPGKVLLPIADKPMMQHVYERAMHSGALSVIIATDDTRVADVAKNFGADVCMTDAAHLNGTARIEEVVRLFSFADDAVIVGLQADEPMMSPLLIQQVARNVHAHSSAAMATLSVPLETLDDVLNPNVVKVVTDHAGYALYFSRAPIPFDRDHQGKPAEFARYHRHIGLYAYRAGFLKEYITWPPAPIELLESLEQLRVLWRGLRIHVETAVAPPGIGVDTREDWERVCALWSVNT